MGVIFRVIEGEGGRSTSSLPASKVEVVCALISREFLLQLGAGKSGRREVRREGLWGPQGIWA